VASSAREVARVKSERERAAPARVRPLMLSCISVTTGLHESLAARAGLPADIDELAQRAAEIDASLFPNGVAFAKSDALRVWGENTRLLGRIHDEKLEHDLQQILGGVWVTAMTETTNALGEATGADGSAREPGPSSKAMSDALAKYRAAIGGYCRMLAGETDIDDEASVARYLAAMAPIDAHRAGHRAGASEGDTGESTTPTSTEPTSTSTGNVPAPASTDDAKKVA
jgi:hypothetical protein